MHVGDSGETRDNVRGVHDVDGGDQLEDMLHAVKDQFDDNPSMLESLLSDSEKPLYEGCTKYTRLSAILKLYNLKAGHGWTDTSFNMLLELVKDMLPKDNVLPDVSRTHHESLESCPICKALRYKKREGAVPAKVLWYFPIVPSFKRWFSKAEDAKKLTWHFDSRVDDGMLRHLADSPQWRFIDGKFPKFANEKHNLRLALSTDKFNPFSSLSSTYSTWPVMLVTYNLPPSLCMKRRFMFLSLLFQGSKQPGNDIDVYLTPLIDDLIMLWEEGVEVFNAHRNEKFNLKAMLFCTIQDFPAYGNLSGYTVKGEITRPIGTEDYKGTWLKASRKHDYSVHCQFLPPNHPYRRRKNVFYGKQEFKGQPKVILGEKVFDKVKNIEITFGKKHKSTLSMKGLKKVFISLAASLLETSFSETFT
ncbi:uncharacterized protein LOC110739374 [Chenopodium quinoa]|uniref:uncharacterized protein LOC110739374 n=1 Tax=Chenopodium quinoa TaxID=63459 RepID=UPI000B788C7E|nr:uncharacterized protein LOC110739374 [Chenopodium quinoa]